MLWPGTFVQCQYVVSDHTWRERHLGTNFFSLTTSDIMVLAMATLPLKMPSIARKATACQNFVMKPNKRPVTTRSRNGAILEAVQFEVIPLGYKGRTYDSQTN